MRSYVSVLVPLSMALTLALFIVGCAPESEQIDLEAERSAVLDTDRAWSEAPPDVARFISFFAEGAHFLPADAPLTIGKDNIEKIASQLFTSPGFSLTWGPTMADVSSAGDLGYSVGTFELTVDDSEGNAVTRKGKYTTVWRKQADGQWKVVADTFNFDSPATENEG